MSKRIDLTGQRFGALTAVRPVPPAETADHRPGWLVRCECGTEKVVNGSNLRKGAITSCGCGIARGKKVSEALKAKASFDDLTGQTFFELTAKEHIAGNRWSWVCSCGKTTTARAVDVKAGIIRSCGHLLSDTAREKMVDQNVVGHYDGTTVSRLRAIMADPETKGVRPRCSSGGIVTWQARIVLRGKAINLGTYNTRAEAEAARREVEKKYYLPIIQEYDREQIKDSEAM